MNIVYFGIDPGVTGAISVIDRYDTQRYNHYFVSDLPVTPYTYLNNQSKMLDIPAFSRILDRDVPDNADYAVFAIEQMQGMGFKTPAKTLTMLAEMAGAIEATVRMVCLYKKVPLFIRKYQPRIWTHWLFPDSDMRSKNKTEAKNDSLLKAQELFPKLKPHLKLKKHHDRAESLLLAFTGLAEMQGCIIDPKLKTFGALSDVYLIHKQDSGSKIAKFTDIYEVDRIQDTLLKEIEARKAWQK
jgi:hypothetical protein